MENIPGTDRLGPGDMEMADIIGIEWNERLHNTAGWAGTNVGTHITHYFHFQQSRERESPCPSRVGPYPINIQQMRFACLEQLLSSNEE